MQLVYTSLHEKFLVVFASAFKFRIVIPLTHIICNENKGGKRNKHVNVTGLTLRHNQYTGHTQKNGAVSKVNKNVCLILHGHNIHRQRRQLSKFLMRYQQFASHAYCVAAGPVSKMALQQEKAFCVLHFEVSRSVITVQREFLSLGVR
jgi:hypothetical protein